MPSSASTRAWPLPVGAAEKAEKATLAPMPADIAAGARVIARRPSGRKERGRLDLHGSYLFDVHLSRAYLSGARHLTREQLNGAASTKGAALPDYLKDPS